MDCLVLVVSLYLSFSVQFNPDMPMIVVADRRLTCFRCFDSRPWSSPIQTHTLV